MSASAKYIQVPPLSASTDTNFQTSVQFQYTIPAGKAMAAYESFLSVSIQTRYGDATTPIGSRNSENNATHAATEAVCVNSNPVACLFSKMTHKINDVTVSNVDLVPITSTMMTLASYNKPTISTVASSNPIWINERKTGLSSITPYAAAGFGNANPTGAQIAEVFEQIRNGSRSIIQTSRVKSRFEQIRSKGLEQPTSTYTEVRYNWVPSFGTFGNSNMMIPGNTRHNIEFNIDSNWVRQFITGYTGYGNNTGAGLPVETGTTISPQTINLLVKNIVLYISVHDVYEPIPPTVSMNTTEAYTSTKSLLSQNDKIAFNIPPGVRKILIGFVDSRYGSSTVRSPTNFCLSALYGVNNSGVDPPAPANAGEFDPPFLENLREVGITFGGESYPVVPYDFAGYGLLSAPVVPFISNSATSDVYRAFQDFIMATDGFADAAGSMYDWVTWAANPIFAFRITTPQGDMSRDLIVNVRLANQVSNVLCVVVCLYDKMTSISYTKEGVVSNVKVDDLI